MIRVIKNVLDEQALQHIRGKLEKANFQDGRVTALGRAKEIKENEQLRISEDKELIESLWSSIRENKEFIFLAKPKGMSIPVINRYSKGHSYGWHTDNSQIDGIRTDISYTLFLSNPDEYTGGELQFDLGSTRSSVKLPAGDMIIYPTQYLHRVAEVEEGQRIAVIGWVESYIRNELKRDTLLGLESAYQRVKNGDTSEESLNTFYNSVLNLRRMWIDE